MEDPEQDASSGSRTGGIKLYSADDPTWPEEAGQRALSMSTALAQRCAVGLELLDLAAADSEDDTPSRPPPTANVHLFQSQMLLPLPCVPGSVPSHGVAVLNAWALRASEAAARGQPEGAWLPSFLAEHAKDLAAAACAADFLGCRAFQDVFLEVQLLRLAALADEGALRQALAAGGAEGRCCKVPPVALLSETDFRKLPRMRQPDQQQQQQQEPQGVSGPRNDQMPTPPASTTLVDQAGPSGAVEAEWDEFYGEGGRQRQVSERAPQRQRRVEQEPATGLLPLRSVAVEEMDALVRGLMDSSLLRYTGGQPHDVGSCLFELGFRPTLQARTTAEVGVTNRKAPYLTLPLDSSLRWRRHERQQQPADGGWSGLVYEVAEISIEVESHDQGWSDYHDDHNTTNNSWTWFELAVLGGPEDQPLRPGDPGRLFTNLHAVSRWQTHAATLAGDSQVVRDINAWMAERGRGGDGKEGAGGARGGDGGGGEGVVGSGEEAEGQGCKLVLLACAAFPGWRNSVRRAEVTVTLRPVPMS